MVFLWSTGWVCLHLNVLLSCFMTKSSIFCVQFSACWRMLCWLAYDVIWHLLLNQNVGSWNCYVCLTLKFHPWVTMDFESNYIEGFIIQRSTKYGKEKYNHFDCTSGNLFHLAYTAVPLRRTNYTPKSQTVAMKPILYFRQIIQFHSIQICMCNPLRSYAPMEITYHNIRGFLSIK